VLEQVGYRWQFDGNRRDAHLVEDGFRVEIDEAAVSGMRVAMFARRIAVY
jgi:hypothetical protein